jgi:hypothetical protein
VIVVSWCGGLAGVAAYQLANGTVCVVHEFALHPNLSCERDLVVNVAMDALEATCLASGSYAISVLRTDIAPAVFKRRGYAVIIRRGGGAWLQKPLSPRRADQIGNRALR